MPKHLVSSHQKLGLGWLKTLSVAFQAVLSHFDLGNTPCFD